MALWLVARPLQMFVGPPVLELDPGDQGNGLNTPEDLPLTRPLGINHGIQVSIWEVCHEH